MHHAIRIIRTNQLVLILLSTSFSKLINTSDITFLAFPSEVPAHKFLHVHWFQNIHERPNTYSFLNMIKTD